MYYTKKLSAEIDTGTLIDKYIQIETFENCCKQCPNYGKIYSCPPYGFDRIEFLRGYARLEIAAQQILFDKKLLGKAYSPGEIKAVYQNILDPERKSLDNSLLAMEARTGGRALFAGSCPFCAVCARVEGKPCAYPEKMRYRIESIGGDAVGLARDYLGVEILWAKENRLPQYFLQVGGLLLK